MATDGLPDLNTKPSTLNLIRRSPIGVENRDLLGSGGWNMGHMGILL